MRTGTVSCLQTFNPNRCVGEQPNTTLSEWLWEDEKKVSSNPFTIHHVLAVLFCTVHSMITQKCEGLLQHIALTSSVSILGFFFLLMTKCTVKIDNLYCGFINIGLIMVQNAVKINIFKMPKGMNHMNR